MANDPIRKDQEPDDYLRKLIRFIITVIIILAVISIDYKQLLSSISSLLSGNISNGENPRIYTGLSLLSALILSAGVAIFICFVWSVMQRQVADHLSRRRESKEIAELRALLEERKQEVNHLQQKIEETNANLKKMSKNLYKDGVVRHNISGFYGKYFINNNGDLSVKKEITISAGADPVHYWQFYITADQTGDEAMTLKHINFEAEPADEGVELAVLSVDSRPRRKIVVFWFLPEIEPGGSRTIKIRYLWPGMMRGLLINGNDSFRWTNQSRDTGYPGDFSVEFRFSTGLKIGSCESTKATSPGVILREALGGLEQGWEFSGRDVPIGNTDYELTFTLADA